MGGLTLHKECLGGGGMRNWWEEWEKGRGKLRLVCKNEKKFKIKKEKKRIYYIRFSLFLWLLRSENFDKSQGNLSN